MGALKNNTTKAQTKDLLKYLETHNGITASEAWKKFGIERVSARIWDLRRKGHNIRNEWYKYENDNGNMVRFVKYVLVKEAV